MKEQKAHVELFGNTIDEDSSCGKSCSSWRGWNGCCRSSGSPVCGVMFLFAGITFLLNVFGKVPWSIWHEIWKFWPVILIFFGIQMLSDLFLFLLAVFVFGIILIFSLQSVGSPLVAQLNLPAWVGTILVELRRIMP